MNEFDNVEQEFFILPDNVFYLMGHEIIQQIEKKKKDYQSCDGLQMMIRSLLLDYQI